MEANKTRVRMTLVFYLSILFLITLTPISNESEALFGIFRFGGLVERVLNLFLLLPLPFLIMRGFDKESLILLVLCGPSLSTFIEFAQKFIPGRISDPLDFALNSLGYLVCLVFLQRRNGVSVP